MGVSEELSVLYEDEHCQFPQENGARLLRADDTQKIGHAKKLIAMVSVPGLREVSEILKRKNKKHHLKALLIHQEDNLEMGPNFLDWSGFTGLKKTIFHKDETMPKRIINAWEMDAEKELIADASIQGDTMLVLNCALDRFEFSIDEISSLRDLSEDVLNDFEIDRDGSFIHWPEPDIHLDLEVLRVATNPELKEEYERKKLKHNEQFGQAIQKFRQEAGMTQSDIDGLSQRQVSRIENGESDPRSESLRKFADAHDMELNDYLNKVAEYIEHDESDDREIIKV